MFSWSVKAIYDGASSSPAVAGSGFNTLTCEVVSGFPFIEDFEDGLTAIPCWTKISNNKENGETGETPFGVFKGANFDPVLTPASGEWVWRFSSESDYNPYADPDIPDTVDYNQYLITPELAVTESDKSVSFFYKIFRIDNPEKFRVGYSTTGTDVAGFTWLPEVTYSLDDAGSWHEHNCIVPGNAKYVAINYYSVYLYYLYIDDITIDVLKPDAIATVHAAPSVYPTITSGSVMVNTVSDARVKVMDIAGRTLATYQSTGRLSIDLNYTNGVYFISVENGKTATAHKVVLQR
jgi:hypothetical protein